MHLPEIENMYIMDGREFIEKEHGQLYDAVIHDVFTGGSVDPNLASLEVFTRIREILKEDGVFVMVLTSQLTPESNACKNYFDNINSAAARIIYTTIRAVFPHISTRLESDNAEDLGHAYNIVCI